jgi:Uma2 family endonuclease
MKCFSGAEVRKSATEVGLTERTYTPEDLLRLPEGKHCELIDSRMVEKHGGALVGAVAGRIIYRVGMFVEERNLGFVFTSTCGFQCFGDDPPIVLKPSVSFVRLGRLANDKLPEGHVIMPPDLAVQVVSPMDRAYDVERRVADYIEAGIPLIWIVYPNTKTVQAIEHGRSERRLTLADDLSGSDVLPGFHCSVTELFP